MLPSHSHRRGLLGTHWNDVTDFLFQDHCHKKQKRMREEIGTKVYLNCLGFVAHDQSTDTAKYETCDMAALQ